MMHHQFQTFIGKCKYLLVLTCILTYSNVKSQIDFNLIDEDYFCAGKELTDDFVPGNFNTLNPCTQYNRELPLDLIFEDNFDGTSLNTENWLGDVHPHAGYFNKINENGGLEGRPPTLDYVWSYWDDLNNQDKHYEINNGTIKLITRKLDTPVYKNVVESNYVCADDPLGTPLNQCTIDDGFPNNRAFYYTNGGLYSRRKYKHGYFEARIKLPSIDGVWPAFWLAPSHSDTEIDIFEFNQEDDGISLCVPSQTVEEASKKMIMTHHEWYSNGTNKCHSSSAIAQNFNFSNEWHIYGFYWDEYMMIWSIDAQPAKVVFRYFYEYFDIFLQKHRQYLYNCSDIIIAIDEGRQIREIEGYPSETTLINIGEGVKNYGSFYNPLESLNEACGSSSAIFPKTLEIDWVRIWARRACESDYSICLSNDLPSNIAAKKITMAGGSCHVIVENPNENDAYSGWAQVYHNGQTIDAVATENIKLLPGFKVKQGAEFRGRIEPCYGADLRSTSSNNEHIYNLLNQVYLKKTNNEEKTVLIENKIGIYPNPTSNVFNISYPENISTENLSLFIYDNTGRLLFTSNEKINTLDISDYSTGIYFLEVRNNQGIFREKLIKN